MLLQKLLCSRSVSSEKPKAQGIRVFSLSIPLILQLKPDHMHRQASSDYLYLPISRYTLWD